MLHTKQNTTSSPCSLSFTSPSIEGDGGGVFFKKSNGFTLVELIVVVTILAILATIGFVSYSSYLTGVRDTNRIAQMTSLSDGLNLYSTTNDLPIPEDNVEVSIDSTLIAYQGYAGANILETINFEKGGVDPRDNTYFSYYLTRDRKYFQLMGFLEESAELTTHLIPNPSTLKGHQGPLEEKGVTVVSLSPKGEGIQGGGLLGVANAVNLQDRIPTVTGKKLGILTDDNNTPIQELGSDLDITSSTTGFIARLTNDDALEDNELVDIEVMNTSGGKLYGSCKDLLKNNRSVQDQDGEYYLSISGFGFTKVYCDMTTDGGGWTFFLHVDSAIHGTNFFEDAIGTYMSDRSDTGEHYSLSSSIFEHTEMMVTREAVTPETTTYYRAFSYNEGHSGFNKGPIPCSGLQNFSYKTSINGNYIKDISNSPCNTIQWYATGINSSTDYIALFVNNGVSTNAGTFFAGHSWNEESYWYLR